MLLQDIIWEFAWMIAAFIVMVGIPSLMIGSILDLFYEADPLARATLGKLARDLLQKAEQTGNTIAKVFAIMLIYFRWALLLALDLYIIYVIINYPWTPAWLRSWLRAVFPF